MAWNPTFAHTVPGLPQWGGQAADPMERWGRHAWETTRGAVKDRAVYCTGLLLAVVMHHWVLCYLHTRGYPVSVSLVALSEVAIYAACVPLLLSDLSLRGLISLCLVLGATGVLALARGGYFDPKSARDLMIPLLFLWAGRSFGRRGDRLDMILLIVMAVVIAIGLAEALMPDVYGRFFNTFSYYINLGGISASSAQVAGQSVTLNALRPEGIGRTLLPQLLGAQRVSSVFLEPVSLGNFSVILMAFGLAKPADQWRKAAWFIGGALVLITLADSRFGMYTMVLLVLLRPLLRGRGHLLAMSFPLIGICALLAVANFAPGYGDTLYGRITTSGRYLAAFDQFTLLGLRDFSANFGDMGYCYVISRFSLPGAMLMWAALFALPLHSETARRFRTFASLYIALILCVSGTSLFALKTAGILWFAFGALSVRPATPPPAPEPTDLPEVEEVYT